MRFLLEIPTHYLTQTLWTIAQFVLHWISEFRNTSIIYINTLYQLYIKKILQQSPCIWSNNSVDFFLYIGTISLSFLEWTYILEAILINRSRPIDITIHTRRKLEICVRSLQSNTEIPQIHFLESGIIHTKTRGQFVRISKRGRDLSKVLFHLHFPHTASKAYITCHIHQLGLVSHLIDELTFFDFRMKTETVPFEAAFSSDAICETIVFFYMKSEVSSKINGGSLTFCMLTIGNRNFLKFETGSVYFLWSASSAQTR